MNKPTFIKWFNEIGMDDVSLVGGKNASLGEMYQHLVPQGIRIPNGFAVTAQAYFYFIETNQLNQKIQDLLSDLDTQNNEILQQRGKLIRECILNAVIPQQIQKEILVAYRQLGESSHPIGFAVVPQRKIFQTQALLANKKHT